MANTAVPAAFQNMTKPDEISFNVSRRVLDGVTHARLCCEINYRIKAIVGKKPLHLALVRDIGFDEIKLLPRR